MKIVMTGLSDGVLKIKKMQLNLSALARIVLWNCGQMALWVAVMK